MKYTVMSIGEAQHTVNVTIENSEVPLLKLEDQSKPLSIAKRDKKVKSI